MLSEAFGVAMHVRIEVAQDYHRALFRIVRNRVLQRPERLRRTLIGRLGHVNGAHKKSFPLRRKFDPDLPNEIGGQLLDRARERQGDQKPDPSRTRAARRFAKKLKPFGSELFARQSTTLFLELPTHLSLCVSYTVLSHNVEFCIG